MTLNIFEFLDYREYLKIYIEYRQIDDNSFSIREFKRKLSLEVFSLLSEILNAKRNILLELRKNVSYTMGFNIQESNYFLDLMNYNQAKDLYEKELYFKKVLNLIKTLIQIKTKNHYKYNSKWYHHAIRTVLDTYDFHSDYHALAKKLIPRIPPYQAKRSLCRFFGTRFKSECN